jgi:hypothetical protein
MVPPAAVIPRGSTATLPAVDDPIAAALDYIEENPLRGIVVKNILFNDARCEPHSFLRGIHRALWLLTRRLHSSVKD